MKKLLISLISIFIVSIPFISINTVFADEPAPETPWGTTETEEEKPTEKPEDVWIDIINEDCLMWMWQWCFDYEKAIWISDAQNPNISATSIVKDIIFAATYMVWTVLTIVIIRCGLGYILASRDGKDATKYRKWLVSAAIWAILVWWSYAIVRLIQYIARWY